LKLTHGKVSASELARPFQVSLPAISKHLRVLENAGLIARERDGRIHRFHIVPRRLKEASHWINRYRKFWEERFESLEKYLEPINKEEKT
jgi:DNA-binding transcriptional ArsR family regulator